MRLLRNIAVCLALFIGSLAWAVDLTITAASVVPDSGYGYVDISAGETITAGQVIYMSAATTGKLAHCETSATTATVRGIALHGASASQPLRVMTSGTVTIGATTTVGKIYVLSTAGKIAPVDDLVTNDYVSIIGVGTTSAKIKLSVLNSGVKVP